MVLPCPVRVAPGDIVHVLATSVSRNLNPSYQFEARVGDGGPTTRAVLTCAIVRPSVEDH